MLASHALDEPASFILSTLSVRDRPSLAELDAIIGYTGFEVTAPQLAALEAQHYIARESDGGVLRFVLTADGREASLRQIAHAKAVEVQDAGGGNIINITSGAPPATPSATSAPTAPPRPP